MELIRAGVSLGVLVAFMSFIFPILHTPLGMLGAFICLGLLMMMLG